MNSHRLLSPGPAQRAASEISNTMNGLAAGVREMSATLDELRDVAKAPAEPEPPVEQQTDPPTVSAGLPTSSPPPMVLPPVPDFRPQLEAFVNTVVRNQQQMIGLLQNAQQVLNAHAAQISALRQQIDRQQNMVGNLRRP